MHILFVGDNHNLYVYLGAVMIAINLICVGKIKEKFFVDAICEYQKRLKSFCMLKIIELKETNYSNPTKGEIEKIKEIEGKLILEKLTPNSVLLDVMGMEKSSEEFAKSLEEAKQKTSEITFVIGGSYGVSDEVKKKIGTKISFSRLTFPHQLMRVIFLEQLYRGFTINANKTYHK